MGNELTKIDRALECQVIDWLQWGEFEEKLGEPSMPDLALKIISKRKLALIAEQEKVRKLTEALEWLTLSHDVDTSTKQRSDYWANQFKIAIKLARKALKEIEASDE